MTKMCVHSFISGVVQGVCFRACTQEKARELQLTGWVRNLTDGRIEVLACGETAVVKQLQDWLDHGPQAAKVATVVQENCSWQSFPDFSVRNTE